MLFLYNIFFSLTFSFILKVFLYNIFCSFLFSYIQRMTPFFELETTLAPGTLQTYIRTQCIWQSLARFILYSMASNASLSRFSLRTPKVSFKICVVMEILYIVSWFPSSRYLYSYTWCNMVIRGFWSLLFMFKSINPEFSSQNWSVRNKERLRYTKCDAEYRQCKTRIGHIEKVVDCRNGRTNSVEHSCYS